MNEPGEENVYSFSFPLDVGNAWEYDVVWTFDDSSSSSSALALEIVSVEQDDNGNAVYEFTAENDSLQWTSYYLEREDGLYLYASEPGGETGLWKSNVGPLVEVKTPSLLLVPYRFGEGEKWAYDVWEDSSGVDTLQRIFRGMETVETEAGTFECYKFESEGYGEDTRYHYYAENVGLVMKESVLDSFPLTERDLETGVLLPGKYVRSVRTHTLKSWK